MEVVVEEGLKSIIGELPGDNRILKLEVKGEGEVDDGFLGTTSSSWFRKSGIARLVWAGDDGVGGGGGGVEICLEAGQHKELSGEIMVGGSSFR